MICAAPLRLFKKHFARRVRGGCFLVVAAVPGVLTGIYSAVTGSERDSVVGVVVGGVFSRTSSACSGGIVAVVICCLQ